MKTLVTIMTTGLLHDVGRRDEWNDVEHGKRGAKIYEDYYQNSHPLIKILIEYHNRDDQEFEEYLDCHNIENKEFVKIFYRILKDADALDRLRLGYRELDVKYLRFAISRNLVFLAKELLKVDFEI